MDRKVLIAKDDMWLTDGNGFYKEVALGDWDSPDNYREVSKEEYEKMLEADAEVIQGGY